MKKANYQHNIFLNFHPLHRVLVSFFIVVIVYLLIRHSFLNALQIPMVLWDTFALSFLASSWIVILMRPTDQIRKWARKEDGSKFLVYLLLVLSSFASIITVTMLITSSRMRQESPLLYISLALVGILLSWIMVHTIFTFHYAHLYYDDDDDDNSTADAGGLSFPGGLAEPDYRDFAYFAFVIGMTFQVSDISITSSKLRRTVLFHGLLSFALNTFVVALMINLIAGFRE